MTVTRINKPQVDEIVENKFGYSMNHYRSVKPSWSRSWYDIIDFGKEGVVGVFRSMDTNYAILIGWHQISGIV